MNATALNALGWKPCFELQLSVGETEETTIVRVGAHFGSQVLCISADNEWRVPTSLIQSCGEVTVGDWLLIDPQTHRAIRRLDRESLVARRAAGENVRSQLIAANLDTLFVVSSCNHDFNLSRLERYLALTIEAKVTPVVVLTKADECDDPSRLSQQATQLRQGLVVEVMDARDVDQASSLHPWCRAGQTVAIATTISRSACGLVVPHQLCGRRVQTHPIGSPLPPAFVRIANPSSGHKS